MSRLNVCRLCLADDLPLRRIANTYLHEIFEKLTGVQLITNDMKPIVVCYTCCTRLHHSYQLRVNSFHSEALLDQIIKGLIPQNQVIIPKRSFGKALVAVVSTSGEGWDDLDPVYPGIPAIQETEVIKHTRNTEIPLEQMLAINSAFSTIKVDSIEIIESDSEDHKDRQEIKREMEEQTDIRETGTGVSITDRLIIENIEEEVVIKSEIVVEETVIQPNPIQIIHTKKRPLKKTRTDSESHEDMLNSPPKKRPVLFKEPTLMYPSIPNSISLKTQPSQVEKAVQEEPTTSCLIESIQDGGVKIQDGGIKIQDCRSLLGGEIENVLQSKLISSQVKEESKNTCSDEDIHSKEVKLKAKAGKNNKNTSLRLKGNVNAKKNLVRKAKVIKTKNIETTINTANELNSTLDTQEANNKNLNNATSVVENKFKCHICDQSFPRMGGLVVHIRKEHPKELPFQCDLCQKRFSKNVRLVAHRRVHNKKITFSCDICNKTFTIKKSFQKHKQSHAKAVKKIEAVDKLDNTSNNDISSSNICSDNSIDLTQEPENKFECFLCDKVFKHRLQLIMHVKKYHTYECKICAKRFATKKLLETHKQSHKSRKFKCYVCLENFDGNKSLTKHKRQHVEVVDVDKPTDGASNDNKINISGNNSRPDNSVVFDLTEEPDNNFKCHVCDESFSKIDGLVKHAKNVHSNLLPYQCNICKKRFASVSLLTKHMRSHTDLQCDVSINNLEDHNLSNDEKNDVEKPAKVDELVTTTSDSIKNEINDISSSNINSETLEPDEPIKKFKCNICEERFTLIDVLVDHVRQNHTNDNANDTETSETKEDNADLTHDAENNFKCHVCNYSFPRMGGLVVHIRKDHPKVLPYECKTCKRRFSKNGALIKHARQHTDPIIFKCDVCDKTFTAKKGLQCHRRAHFQYWQ